MKFSLTHLISLLDLTSLNELDSNQSITQLCQAATTPFGVVAAVCVYPRFVAHAKAQLKNSVRVASVANFPSGNASVQEVSAIIRHCMNDGVDEMDVVFPYRAFLANNTEAVLDFVRHCRQVCGNHILLKIILETGEIKEPEKIAAAARLAIQGGADFIKTSTGKTEVGATPEAARAILTVIEQHGQRDIGFKVSGGVREIVDAMGYVEQAAELLGESYVTPKNFRIGASQLLEHIQQTLRQGA